MFHAAEYYVWYNMMRRCYDPTDKGSVNYGARGITVCKRWHTYANFLADMKERPPGRKGGRPLYVLDRIDNDLNYTPDNCKWSTQKESANNRRPRSRNKNVSKLKLSTEQVIAIRADQRLHRVIADEYGVSREMISSIIRGVRR